MAVFEIQGPNGGTYQIDAPDMGSAVSALKKMSGPAAIDKGDWSGLASRLDEAARKASDMGPMNPATTAAVRQEAARQEGLRYGARNAGTGTGLIEEGLGRAMDKAAFGLPRLAEAYMPGALGGQSAVPGAEAHEFLKAADRGRAATNPKTALAGDVTGLVAQTIAMPASKAVNLGGRMATSAAQAAGLGAADAAVESRGDMGEIGKGAGYGFIGGALGQAGGETLVRAGRALVDPLRGLAKSGPVAEQAAARIALEAKNAKTPQSLITQRLDDLGPEAFLGDALGLQGATMARSAANLSPEARSLLETASQSRVLSQPTRLMQDYAAASGNPAGKTTQQIADYLSERTRPAITRAYETALAAGYDLPYTPFENLLASPKVSGAVKQAIAETQDRIAAFGGDQNSRLAVYDAAKKILDQKGWKEGDDIAKVLAKKLRETVDQYVPEYGGARALASSVKRSQEGLEIGAQAAGRNPGRDVGNEIAAAVQGGVPQGRIAQGYGATKADQLANRGGSEINLKLPPAEEAAMRAALGPKADDVLKALERERTFMKFHKEVTGNSTTARQLAQQMTGAGLVGGGVGWATDINPMAMGAAGASMALGRRGFQKVIEASKGKNERAVAEQLAKFLTGRNVPQPARTETARRALVEALIKDLGRAGGYSAGQ